MREDSLGQAFGAAVAAIDAGDASELARLLDAEPRLLHVRDSTFEGASDPADYFYRPKLFWFVANNPTRVAGPPRASAEIVDTMLDRGVDRADLDYALELTMTNRVAREQGYQLPLMRRLQDAGARATTAAIVATAAHREHAALRALLAGGYPLDAPIAAALGANDELTRLLGGASAEDVRIAFALAVVNDNLEGTRIALAAGADPIAYLPVHAHSTALHQAALTDDVALIELLLACGARPDARDRRWNATPLEWARHENRANAASALSGAA